jgi:hypothetical protein
VTAPQRRQITLERIAWQAGAAAASALLTRAAPRVATGWTAPLQYSVVPYLLNAAWSIFAPFVMAGPMSDFIQPDGSAERAAQSGRRTAFRRRPPPSTASSQWASIGAGIGVAIAVVAIP